MRKLTIFGFLAQSAKTLSCFDIKSYHSIIRESEKPTGEVDRHEFKAETRMLLDIVAKSLYSENEVFVRELISNASDAIEKFRYLANTAEAEKIVEKDRKLEIHIETNKQDRKLIIQDKGIGMTKEELIDSLGTIARSGSKNFIQQMKAAGNATTEANIIGQFGVGFYSVFMCATEVQVYTKSSGPDSTGYRWTSDGSGSFEVQECEDVDVGTKIVIFLKPECREYADENKIRDVVKKYSNFVGSPIFLNGNQLNLVQPLWLMEPKEVTDEQHNEFYRYIANSFDVPRFKIHFKTDVPVSRIYDENLNESFMTFAFAFRFQSELCSTSPRANLGSSNSLGTPTPALLFIQERF